MIKLVVEDYCHDGCRAFEAEVVEPAYYSSDDSYQICVTNTVVRCAKRNLCKQLLTYLKKVDEKADEHSEIFEKKGGRCDGRR